MKEKENKINLLKQEVKLLKNRLNGPTVNYDLLVENAEEQEINIRIKWITQTPSPKIGAKYQKVFK